jgi:hypothetical protein
MILSRSKLIKSEPAIEKYKNRNVKIFCAFRFVWLSDGAYSIKKEHAQVYTLNEALKRTESMDSQSRIEFHFEDSLGEKVFDINDYDDESIYNCPNIQMGYRMNRRDF